MKSRTYWATLAQLRLANEAQSPLDRLKAYKTAFHTASRRVKRTALRGLYTRIDPSRLPPPNAPPARHHYCRTPQDLAWASSELRSYISQGILYKSSHPNPLTHPFFVVKKKGKRRLVVDFLLLNRAILESPRVKYEDLSLLPSTLPRRAWMISIDIKAAFHHISLSPHLQHLCSIHFEGHTYSFRVMTFGINIAPKVWCSLITYVLDKLRKPPIGFRILVYMDDILLCHPKRRTLRLQASTLISHLIDHGLILSWEKSVLQPTRLLRHLGFLINSETMSLSLPPDKIQDLVAFLYIAAHKPTLRLNSALSLFGKILAANKAFLPARRYTWRLCKEIYSQLPPKSSRWLRSQFRLRLSPEVRQDLLWMHRNLPLAPSRSFLPLRPSHVLYTDSSLTGWGAFCPTTGQGLAGRWPPSLAHHHIQVLEMLAVNHAISHLNLPSGSRVHLFTDNLAVLYYLQKWGGTRSVDLRDATHQIWDSLLARNLALVQITYVPSDSNRVADLLSRLHS